MNSYANDAGTNLAATATNMPQKINALPLPILTQIRNFFYIPTYELGGIRLEGIISCL